MPLTGESLVVGGCTPDNRPMTRDEFREALLGVMEQKQHWAWASFTRKPRV